MSINFTSIKSIWDTYVHANFKKSITRTPVTVSNDNVSGTQIFTDGTPETIEGIVFRKDDEWAQDKQGLFRGADIIVICKTTQTLNKEDKLAYDSETFRIDEVHNRMLGTQEMYHLARCFLHVGN